MVVVVAAVVVVIAAVVVVAVVTFDEAIVFVFACDDAVDAGAVVMASVHKVKNSIKNR